MRLRTMSRSRLPTRTHSPRCRQIEPLACRGSAGLGLAIARAIVDAHGGRIWVVDPGPARQGTRIRFSLPAA